MYQTILDAESIVISKKKGNYSKWPQIIKVTRLKKPSVSRGVL